MLITNDVALLTFVPFSFAVLGQLPEASGKKLLTPVVCLQTIAANLGSMLTPSTLRIYICMAKANCPFPLFAAHAPLYAAVCHPAFCLHFLSGTSASAANSLFLNPESDYKRCTKKPALIRLYIVLFFLLPPCRFACASLPGSLCPRPLGALIADKKVLAQVDYSPARHVSRIFYFHRKSRQNSRLCLLAFCSALRSGNPHQCPRLPGHEQRSGGAFAVRLFQ